MRGLVLTELLDFAARELPVVPDAPRFDPTADYGDAEVEQVLARLAEANGLTRAVLLRRFGRQLFARFAALFPVFPAGADSALDFLASFESVVHDELRALPGKLDPPRVVCVERGPDVVELVYRSPRRMGDLMEGLLVGCAVHFGEDLGIVRSGAPPEERFRIERRRRR
jgi:Haem-NO-binding